MMSFQISKRFYRRVAGALLVALPLGGAALRLLPVQAQPVPAAPVKTVPQSLAASREVKSVLGLAQQGNVCKRLIDLKIDNASLEDVVERIKQIVPANALSIDVRGAQPVSVSLDLKGEKVGDVLSNVAALAGCKLFVRDKGLIVATSEQLTEFEVQDFKLRKGGEWQQSREAGGEEWGSDPLRNQLLVAAVAQEAVQGGQGAAKTTFGKFSPESQAILQVLADSLNEHHRSVPRSPGLPPYSPVHLGASSAVHVEVKGPESFSIMFPPDLSNPGGMSTGISVSAHHAGTR